MLNSKVSHTQTTRKDILDVAYKAADVSMSFDVFKEMIRDWKLKPVIKNGNIIGVFSNKNSEVHFSILKEYRGKWVAKDIYYKLLTPIFKAYGYITTSVPDAKPYGHKFVTKFGFVKTSHIEGATYYKLEKLKWV